MIRIGILGFDPLLSTCLQIIRELPGFEATVAYSEFSLDAAVMEQYGLRRMDSLGDLLANCDVVLCLSADKQQLRSIEKAIKYHKHIYVHKLCQYQTDYMRHLSGLCEETGVASMIQMDWMHHPITYGIIPHLNQPQRIELDFEGLLDLESDSLAAYHTLLNLTMLLYSLNNSYNSRTTVQRITVAEKNSEALHMRFEYPHGCVADLMLDGVIQTHKKELKIYQKNTYLIADYTSSELTLHHITPRPKNKSKQNHTPVDVEKPKIHIQQLPSLIQFLLAVQNNELIPVGSIADTYTAMKTTDKLAEKIALSEMLMQ
ncbi:MAG: hypothetical protein ACK5AS_11340 [Bacteroidota bacterium]|jgi:hypothetical protein